MNVTSDPYVPREPIFPRSVKGRYRSIKYAILLLAYGVYFLLPWLPWAREHGPGQAVIFDLINRRFYLFDLVVYAQDIFWLAGLLIIGALLLFFVTGIAGRVFCGYFCFQTLWTDVFQFIERLVQGERNARIKLACGAWNARKISLMSVTWLLWLLVAFVTGFSFVLYWGRAPQLFIAFFTGAAPFPAYATTLFLTASTFVMAGLAREQVCTYMCPYARFQAVMFDEHTLIVAYDTQRGEATQGRHKPDKTVLQREQRQQIGYGDCIDCGYCVQVCPTGIDIRNGLQYQCISCALCIDACNSIMDAVHFPPNLIRYTAQTPAKRSIWLQPKNMAYGLALLVASILLVWSVANRKPIELGVEQVRQPLYVMLSDGHVQNHYILKLNNKTSQTVSYTIDLQGMQAEWIARPDKVITLLPEQSQNVDVLVKQPQNISAQVQQSFTFVVSGVELMQGVRITHDATFFNPEVH